MTNSEIILVGSWPQKILEYGATHLPSLDSILTLKSPNRLSVLGLSITNTLESRFNEIYQNLILLNPFLQMIVVAPPEFSSKSLLKLHEKYHFYYILDSMEDSNLEQILIGAFNESLQLQQNQKIKALVEEQNQSLKNMREELNERIEKRTRVLTEARTKLFHSNQRLEDLKKCLLSSQKSENLSDLEFRLNEILTTNIQTAWIRIFIDEEKITDQKQLFLKQIKEELKVSFYQSPIESGMNQIGSIFYIRGHDLEFTREEKKFLNRLSEAISVVIIRLLKLQESKSIKEQWDTAFKAIVDKIIIIDEDYNLLQSNKLLNISDDKKKCYQLLFDRSVPCSHCQLNKSFRLSSINSNNETYDVVSHKLSLEIDTTNYYVNIYRDVSEQLKMEQQILERAKLAELGIIGSSIAHELNNPLAGIISFAQLLLMEIDSQNPFHEDIKEIESAAKKCSSIVENLLNFAKNTSSGEPSTFSLKDILFKAKDLLDIRARPLGLPINIQDTTKHPPLLQGQSNHLLQAINHLLQSCLESLCPIQQTGPSPDSWIKIILSDTENTLNILILDNGEKSLARSVGLSIPIAAQIIRDHGGSLQFSRIEEHINEVNISFSRPVLSS